MERLIVGGTFSLFDEIAASAGELLRFPCHNKVRASGQMAATTAAPPRPVPRQRQQQLQE